MLGEGGFKIDGRKRGREWIREEVSCTIHIWRPQFQTQSGLFIRELHTEHYPRIRRPLASLIPGATYEPSCAREPRTQMAEHHVSTNDTTVKRIICSHMGAQVVGCMAPRCTPSQHLCSRHRVARIHHVIVARRIGPPHVQILLGYIYCNG